MELGEMVAGGVGGYVGRYSWGIWWWEESEEMVGGVGGDGGCADGGMW